MRRKTHESNKGRSDAAKAKIRKALVLLGSAAIMGTASCGAASSPDRTMQNPAPLSAQTQRESEVILTPSEDGTRLAAEVVVYEPGESTSSHINIRQVMEEIVADCRESPEIQQCISNEAIERTDGIRGTWVPDARVEFQYWSSENGRWEALWGVTMGDVCDLSNIAPSTIRVIYTPRRNSGIRPSSAEYQMPQNHSLDSD